MSARLPDCPVCGTGALRMTWNDPADGELHYHVECLSCGIEFHHEDFYGSNNVYALFDCITPDICENYTDEPNHWECSSCGVKRVKADGEPPYKHCPDCGAQVEVW